MMPSQPERESSTRTSSDRKRDCTERRVFIKLCGFADPADLEVALGLDIDAIGIVLADDAKKRLTPSAVRALLRLAAETTICRVAVVGPMGPEECRKVRDYGFDAIQWVAPVEDERGVSEGILGCPIIPVVFDAPHALERCLALAKDRNPTGNTVAETICIDGARGGGRGQPPNWERAARIAEQMPLMLAGGLRPESVARAIHAVKPRAVDVSSGIEAPDGRKSPERMKAFVAAVRGLC